MVEQLVMRAGMIIYSKTVASLGTIAFATHQVCMNIQALSFMNGQAFGVSATSLVGQCLGKRRPDMAEEYSRCLLYTSTDDKGTSESVRLNFSTPTDEQIVEGINRLGALTQKMF